MAGTILVIQLFLMENQSVPLPSRFWKQDELRAAKYGLVMVQALPLSTNWLGRDFPLS